MPQLSMLARVGVTPGFVVLLSGPALRVDCFVAAAKMDIFGSNLALTFRLVCTLRDLRPML